MPDSVDLVLRRKARGSLLAGAIADALGWPQELNNRRPKSERYRQPYGWQFQQWSRRVGGRYLEREEKISAGEYSDDTQLTLCTARSILAGERWLEVFTKVELPTFQLYERGAGRATKRAVESWLSGSTPWTQRDASAREEYFNAGANGAMMRIAPHCLARTAEESFERLAKDIFLNAISTHGHPRAILGALCFGFSAWSSLRMNETLRYGELLHLVLDHKEEWSRIPETPETRDWLSSSPEGAKQQTERWNTTVSEIIEAVDLCSSQLQMHSLSIEHEVLTRLGAFTSERGSGTITAIAAIFLASRFATEPTAGILEAAYAEGADTDTLGSATGQILGAINGDDWLAPLSDEVQDGGYIRDMADKLLGGTKTDSISTQTVTTNTLQKFKKQLDAANAGDVINFPDGREGEVIGVRHSESKSDAVKARSFHLKMRDGQELHVPIIHRDSGDKKMNSKAVQPTQLVHAPQQKEMPSDLIVKVDASLRSQRPVKIEQDTGIRLIGVCHITVTFIPTHCFLIQCERNGSESGSRILYKKDETIRCLTDLGVNMASGVVGDLSAESDDRVERFSFKTDRLEACKKWELDKGSDSDRERERLAKQWIASLINSYAAKRKLADVRLQVEDTRGGSVFRWFIGQQRVSFQVEVSELVIFIMDASLRREVDNSIERMFTR